MTKNGTPKFYCAIHDEYEACITCFKIEQDELEKDVKYCENLNRIQYQAIEDRDKEIKELRKKLNGYKEMINEFKSDYRLIGRNYPFWLRRHFVMEELIERIRTM
jgi:predicted RNase H-like nuclease (RuvC/YqgF family)